MSYRLRWTGDDGKVYYSGPVDRLQAIELKKHVQDRTDFNDIEIIYEGGEA